MRLMRLLKSSKAPIKCLRGDTDLRFYETCFADLVELAYQAYGI